MSPFGGPTACAPDWLAVLQAQFLETVTKPLEVQRAGFEERRDDYPAPLLTELRSPAVRTRVALYHRQYWVRLFNVLQGRFPRFATAVGYFRFNQLAALHLAARPLRQFDVERCADGFFETLQPLLASKLSPLERETLFACVSPEIVGVSEQDSTKPSGEPLADWAAVLQSNGTTWQCLFQALQLDECVHRVFLAPLAEPFRPTAEQLARMPELRFIFAPGVFVVRDGFGLVAVPELKLPDASAVRGNSLTPESAVRFSTGAEPEPRILVKHWLLHRSSGGIAYVELSPEFALFLQLVRRATFGQALLELEQAVPNSQQVAVETALPGWIQYALEKRLWIGAR